MMKIIHMLIFILSVHWSNIQAQNQQLKIEYDFHFGQKVGKYKIYLISNQAESLQTIERNVNIQTAPGVVENRLEKQFIYTDLTKNKIIYWDQYTSINVEEFLNTMRWDLTGKTKKILNYTCTEAKSTWRGRDYFAYFTNELPFKSATWKFHGLPGVILEIKSADKRLSIQAIQLKVGTNLGVIKNPFIDQEIIDWEEFVKIYRSKQRTDSELDAKGRVLFGKKIVRLGARIELITKTDKEYENNFKAFKNKN